MNIEFKNATYTRTHENEIATVDFIYRTNLRVKDKIRFVRSVVETLVEDGFYNAVAKDLIFDYMLIRAFTNIDVNYITEEDTEKDVDSITLIEELLEETDIVDILNENVDGVVIGELRNAVDENIAYLTGIHNDGLTMAFSSFFRTIENKIGEFDLGNIIDMVQKIANMDGDITPEKFVKAYVDSDAFKEDQKTVQKNKQTALKRFDNVKPPENIKPLK